MAEKEIISPLTKIRKRNVGKTDYISFEFTEGVVEIEESVLKGVDVLRLADSYWLWNIFLVIGKDDQIETAELQPKIGIGKKISLISKISAA